MLVKVFVALIAFGGAAGASWFLQSKAEDPKADDPTVQSAEKSGEKTSKQRGAKNSQAPADPLAIPARAKDMTPEQALLLMQGLSQREGELKNRTKVVEEQERRLKMLLKDMQVSHETIDGMKAGVRGSLDQADKLLAAIQKQDAKLKKDRAEIERLQKQHDVGEDADKVARRTMVKKFAPTLEQMAPADAAKFLVNMNEKEAAEFLFYMEQRNSSKVLTEIQTTSSETAIKILNALLAMKQPAKKKGTR